MTADRNLWVGESQSLCEVSIATCMCRDLYLYEDLCSKSTVLVSNIVTLIITHVLQDVLSGIRFKEGRSMKDEYCVGMYVFIHTNTYIHIYIVCLSWLLRQGLAVQLGCLEFIAVLLSQPHQVQDYRQTPPLYIYVYLNVCVYVCLYFSSPKQCCRILSPNT